ncbi:hypothetical protein [Enterovirga aerilata]|uniref:Uncharacterized protein n=1 Tax=Enterovirga aerilata TaxID=2730920 RepID=A0A849I254_9HYPH|nr:hypothetical protein [Enterovirga sp. DB1703]NNM71428.1 hypothetical protein [Enterovirga sp. DB1703]
MPTIAEPIRPPPAYVPRLNVAEHAAAILADLRDAGIRPTALAVLSRALDVGVPEEVAVEIAATIVDHGRFCSAQISASNAAA